MADRIFNDEKNSDNMRLDRARAEMIFDGEKNSDATKLDGPMADSL